MFLHLALHPNQWLHVLTQTIRPAGKKVEGNELLVKAEPARNCKLEGIIPKKKNLHEIKGTIWGDERDCAVPLKACQPHTLMKFHIL